MRKNKAWRLDEMLYNATTAERWLVLLIGGLSVLVAVLCGAKADMPWSAWQWALVLFVAFDIGGGVAAMCLPPAILKVRPIGGPLRTQIFAAFHIHPLILAIALPSSDWSYMFTLYGAAVAGVASASLAPRAFKGSVALAWCALTLAVIPLLGSAPGLEWMAPAYLLKLVGSHAVPQEMACRS